MASEWKQVRTLVHDSHLVEGGVVVGVARASQSTRIFCGLTSKMWTVRHMTVRLDEGGVPPFDWLALGGAGPPPEPSQIGITR